MYCSCLLRTGTYSSRLVGQMEVVGIVLVIDEQKPRIGIPQRAYKLLIVGAIGMYQAMVEAIAEDAVALLWTMIVEADVGTELPAPDDSVDKLASLERNRGIAECVTVRQSQCLLRD